MTFSKTKSWITQDGGLGDIVNKNILLHDSVTEKLRHANGCDIWVITHEWDTDRCLPVR